MTRILRLLLIAAIALPLWQPMAAQENHEEILKQKKSVSLVHEGCGQNVDFVNQDGVDGNQNIPSKSPSIKKVEDVLVAKSLTVCDGTQTNNQYVPVYGFYFDADGCESQMIYESSLLGDLAVGDIIKSITFYTYRNYTSTVPTAIGTPTVEVYIGKTNNSYYGSNSLVSRGSMTNVFSGKLPTGNSYMTIEFTTPYVYEGGNLIIDTYVPAGSSYNSCYWTGESTSSYKSINRDGNNGSYSRQRFLPRMKIDYDHPMSVDFQAREIVVKDRAFFESKEYTWREWTANDTEETGPTGQEHSSNLGVIARDPDQIIAMLTKIYTDPEIPGNLKRGFNEAGEDEAFNDVNYGGVGTIQRSNSGVFSYQHDYGWEIPGNLISGNQAASAAVGNVGTFYYSYMNPTQYKPNEEGLTLLLVELKDDFDSNEYLETTETIPAKKLRDYISNSISSVRVIPEARRTGEGIESGTLFKIDCDKMNKFFLMAKGQLRFVYNSYFGQYQYGGTNYAILETFSSAPCYVYNSDSYNRINTFYDLVSHPVFYNMFEEFSPQTYSGTGGVTDIYQDLAHMQSFSVKHDCEGVLGIGHQFMLYGADSESADCQDVHDLMFFVPDYRMLKWSGREYSSEYQKFMNYNEAHQPSVGLFVIKQNPITGAQVENQETYKLHLTWTSNLLDFLPGEDGKYTLYRVITNPDGTKTYQKVGNFEPNTFEYDDYVPMKQNGQQVTYVVQGQDVDEFLSLQMSNEESFIIPGLDRAEQIRIALNNDYYFSRYDAAEQTNNYSNSLIANNTIGTNVKPQYIENGSQFKFWRATIDEQTGNVVTPDEPFVVAEVSDWDPATGGTLTYKDWKGQTDFSSKPYGHGYHANDETSTISIDDKDDQITTNDEVVFDGLKLYDNFSVDVSENAHPAQYVYYVTLETAVPFELAGNGIPSCATQQSGTYAYFECAWGSTMRAWAWNEAGNLTGDQWPGTGTMTPVGTHNDNKVWLWTADASVQPTNIKFNWDNASSEEQTGNYPFINGGYYKHLSDAIGETESNQARSNTVSVPVYKTEMVMNPISAAQVEADVTHQFPAATKFDVNARYSSRSEILGYYIYRWADSDPEQPRTIYESDGGDSSPQGQAGNQGEYYTVAMNTDFTGRTEDFGANYADVTASFEDNYMVNDAKVADTYTYAPVVELFAPEQAVNLPSGADRTDYNTYGGPQQMTAGGVLDITVNQYNPSVYSWTGTDPDGQEHEYRYYLVTLKINGDPSYNIVPDGYHIEKVRAWRKIDRKYLGEQAKTQDTPDFTGRLNLDTNGEYMFLAETEECQNGVELGMASVGTSGNNGTVYSGTFGAVSLEKGESIPVSFVVRVYFTKDVNTKADPESADGKYYIAEYTKDDVIEYQVPTAVENLNARQVVGVKYYNVAGIESSTPFDGVNIVVTRYSDGSTTTTKILK